MNFILKHRVFILWISQILVFAISYHYSPNWISTLITSIYAGIGRSNPWKWWKTPSAHLLGLLIGGSTEHLWNVAEVVSAIIGISNPIFYVITVMLVTTTVVSLTAQAIWLWMPNRKEI